MFECLLFDLFFFELFFLLELFDAFFNLGIEFVNLTFVLLFVLLQLKLGLVGFKSQVLMLFLQLELLPDHLLYHLPAIIRIPIHQRNHFLNLLFINRLSHLQSLLVMFPQLPYFLACCYYDRLDFYLQGLLLFHQNVPVVF